MAASPYPVSAIALIIGQEGPKVIQRRDGSTTHLSTLHLADSSLPTGIELRIWGAASLTVSTFRIMDIIRVEKVICNCDARFPSTIFLTHRTASTLTHDNTPDSNALRSWRHRAFPELEALARTTQIRTREWSKRHKSHHVRARAPNSATQAPRCLREAAQMGGGCAELLVRITGVRIAGTDGADALRGLVRLACVLCGAKTAPDQGRECACTEGVTWSFGTFYVVAEDGCGREILEVGNDAVERLLFGISAEMVWKDRVVCMKGFEILKALACDDGDFRVLLKAGTGELGSLSLVRLFV